MKKLLFFSAGVIALTQLLCVSNQDLAAKPDLKTDKEKYSYMIGLDIGGSLRSLYTDLDYNALLWGIQDVIKEREHLMSDSSLSQLKQEFNLEMQSKYMTKMKEDGEKNTKNGETFLAANKKKKDMKTTASGLQYSVIKEGNGPTPKATDVVKVHYRGTLIDGKEFDSSIKRGEPVEFPVNGVIPGWTEALQLMKVGSKYKLVIPPSLAYGDRGAPPDIGPNAVLVFEVELLDIVKKQ
ncbi:MAG: FKBP-type peptidyl-prolyl cis-trans isomerase [Chitinispirillaceae bacterium]|nr:FKBP-type peptidyl-prolyl cis-trans isomerase [Chitinispirillaceae bacterium]